MSKEFPVLDGIKERKEKAKENLIYRMSSCLVFAGSGAFISFVVIRKGDFSSLTTIISTVAIWLGCMAGGLIILSLIFRTIEYWMYRCRKVNENRSH